MVRLQVSYHDPDGRGHYYPFFVNFMDSIERVRGKSVYEVIDETLTAEYGIHGIFGGMIIDNGIVEIEFLTEEDITMFLLRWA